jgi:hypothetical protein
MKNFVILLNRTETNTTETVSKTSLHSQTIYADGFSFRSYKSVNKSEDRTQGVEFYTLSPSNKKVFTGTFFPLSRIVGIYDDQFISPNIWGYGHSTSVCIPTYNKTVSNSDHILVIPAFWNLDSISIIARSSLTEPINFHLISDAGNMLECKYLMNQEMSPNSFIKASIPEDVKVRDYVRTVILHCSNISDYSLDFFSQLTHS